MKNRFQDRKYTTQLLGEIKIKNKIKSLILPSSKKGKSSENGQNVFAHYLN